MVRGKMAVWNQQKLWGGHGDRLPLFRSNSGFHHLHTRPTLWLSSGTPASCTISSSQPSVGFHQ